MTRKEAYKTIKENLCAMCAYGSQCMESCDIRSCDNRDAIKALEQEPIDYKTQYENYLKKSEVVISQLRADRDRLQDAFDKVRAEIKQYQSDYDVHGIEYDRTAWKAFNRCLQIIDKYRAESEDTQSKQTDDSCLDFDFDKVKEILKKDGLDNLIVDHTCEEKQEQTRDEEMIDAIDFAIKVTDSQDDYGMGMRNGMRYVKSLIDDKEPQYELRRTDEEIKLGLDLGDEVIGDFGAKGVVVGIDTYEGDVVLSLLMRNHKVPQLVKASSYKAKTGRHFPQIVEVLDAILP